MFRFSKVTFVLVLCTVLYVIGCSQSPSTTPSPDPVPQEQESVEYDFPPPILDTADVSDWTRKGYGKNPVYVSAPLPFITTKEKIPESAKEFVERNETFSGVFTDNVQVIVNIIEYKSGVAVSLQNAANSVVEQMKGDPSIAEFVYYKSPFEVNVQGLGTRYDGKMLRDSVPSYWNNIMVQRGQEIFQMMTVYPAGGMAGPGIVNEMVESIGFEK